MVGGGRPFVDPNDKKAGAPNKTSNGGKVQKPQMPMRGGRGGSGGRGGGGPGRGGMNMHMHRGGGAPGRFPPGPGMMGPPMGMGMGPGPAPAFPIKEYGFFSSSAPGVMEKHPGSKDTGPPNSAGLNTPSARTVPKGPNLGPGGPFASDRPFIPPPTTDSVRDRRMGGPTGGPSHGPMGGPSSGPMGREGVLGAAPMGREGGPSGDRQPSIHELFGKMVWKKMEQIKDAGTVDRLQAQIMKMIADAIDNKPQQQQASGNGTASQQQQQHQQHQNAQKKPESNSSYPNPSNTSFSSGYTDFGSASSNGYDNNPWQQAAGPGTF